MAKHLTEIEKVEKAYGGCHNCYGKGYATELQQPGGTATDGDIDGPEGPWKGQQHIEIHYCSCSRGSDLLKLTEHIAVAVRVDELDMALKMRGHHVLGGKIVRNLDGSSNIDPLILETRRKALAAAI